MCLSVCLYVCLIFLLTCTIKYYSPWERKNNVFILVFVFGTLSWITKESVKRLFLLFGWIHIVWMEGEQVCTCYFHGHFILQWEGILSGLVSLVQTHKIWEWGSYTFMKNNWSQAIKFGMMTMAWISKWYAINFEVLTNLIVINIKDRFMLTTSSPAMTAN